MSRAININATVEHVSAACSRRKLPVTSIESLLSGGTRVVLQNGGDADTVRKLYGTKVLAGEVRRSIASVR